MNRISEQTAGGDALAGAGQPWRLVGAIPAGGYGALVSGYALPFLLVTYLGLAGGGYDPVTRGEVGVIAWWIVLLGCLIGGLPAHRTRRIAWAAIGLMTALTAWTALALTWTDSTEATAMELARVATLLGVFVLAVFAQGRDGLRRTVCAVGAGVTVIALVALTSRLSPGTIGQDEIAALLPGAAGRLAEPIGYWNGLGAVLAMGLPPLFWAATTCRTVAGRALGAAAIPAVTLASYFTLSRGGIIGLALGLIAFFALTPRRLTRVPTLLVTGFGAVVTVASAAQRPELSDGLTNQVALAQGDEVLVIALFTCAGVGLLQAAITSLGRSEVIPTLRISREVSLTMLGGAIIVLLTAALALGVPDRLSESWSEFKQAGGAGSGSGRLDSSSGNGRYQYWQAAADQFDSAPLTGRGAGTFESWWAANGSVPGFVRDAHSLYLEALGELGLVGAGLLVGLLALTIGWCAAGALRRGSSERRTLLAAVAATGIAFSFMAGIDWAWEVTVVPVILLLLLAAALGPSGKTRRKSGSRFGAGSLPIAGRVAVAVGSAVLIFVVAAPTAGTSLIRQSQAAFADGDPSRALELARTAGRVQPYASAPPLQQALVLEAEGEATASLAAAREATANAPGNWRGWLARSRAAANAGRTDEALNAFRRARQLNPRSLLFR